MFLHQALISIRTIEHRKGSFLGVVMIEEHTAFTSPFGLYDEQQETSFPFCF